jgi:apolipoprotein D and lipocalin family protein
VRRARLALRIAGPCAGLLALSGCVGAPDGVTPLGGFDATRYQGEWFAVMRLDHSFERGLTNVSATYSAQGDGVKVVNRGFDRKACRWRSIEGHARFLESPEVASLAVSFFGPISGGYHVIALDRKAYGWAMVAGPTRDYLWILSRNPQLAPEVRARLIAQARDLGFPVDKLARVDHSAPVCAPG